MTPDYPFKSPTNPGPLLTGRRLLTEMPREGMKGKARVAAQQFLIKERVLGPSELQREDFRSLVHRFADIADLPYQDVRSYHTAPPWDWALLGDWISPPPAPPSPQLRDAAARHLIWAVCGTLGGRGPVAV